MEGKILIADDETDIVVMLSQFFQGKGYRILTATNGVETLKQVENNPDIIFARYQYARDGWAGGLSAHSGLCILSYSFSNCSY